MITRNVMALVLLLSFAPTAHAELPSDPTLSDRVKVLIEQGKEAYDTHVAPRVQAGNEAARQLYSNRVPQRVKDVVQCRDTYKKLGLYAGVPLALAGAGLLYYNKPYSRGEWEDRGTEGMPSMVPKVGDDFVVEERIQNLTFPRDLRTLWVHNGKKGFGRLHVEADKVQYWDGSKLVAESGLISPTGRPYNPDIPVKVSIRDGSGVKIGTVEEVGEEVGDNLHRVSYVVKDDMGSVVGETDSYEETGNAKAKVLPWAVSMKNNGEPVGEVIRKGTIKNSYRWKMQGAEEQVDPRLLIMLSAYKSYVDEIRGAQ